MGAKEELEGGKEKLETETDLRLEREARGRKSEGRKHSRAKVG